MIVAALALLWPALAVFLLVRSSRLLETPGSWPLGVAIAVAAGIGLSSVTTYWLVSLGLPLERPFLVADAALWSVMAGMAWWWGRRRRISPARAASAPAYRPTRLDVLARAVFVVVAAVSVATLVAHYRAAPHGEWDAWAIWNQKARFFYRAGHEWTALFAIEWSNPSHPLLVSTSVARLWAYEGHESTAAPAMLSAAFGAAAVLAVVGALGARRARAWVAGSIVAAPGVFTQLASAQTSDLPAGVFLLLSLVMLREGGATFGGAGHVAPPRLFVAGLLAGLMAWTKNEGLVFLALTGLLVATAAYRRGHLRQAAWWGAGLIPAMLTLAWLKVGLTLDAPVYNWASQQRGTLAERVLSGERHLAIGELAVRMGQAWGGPLARGVLPLVWIAALAGALRGGRMAQIVLAVALPLIVSYYVVWVILPFDTAWIVGTTFDRLMIQLWPSLVLAACSGTGREPS